MDYKLTSHDIDPFLFILFIVLPMIVAILSLVYCFRFLKRARMLEDNPLSKIRSAAQGYVQLQGTISPLFETSGSDTLSTKPCVWYRYRIEEYKTYYTEDETISRWEPISYGISPTPFILKDNTGGECLINPIGAEIITTSALRWYGNTPNPTPFPEITLWTWLFGTRGKFCYLEERLELNTEVYATGMFYTVQRSNPIVQDNPILQHYLAENQNSTLNLLNNEGLGQKQSLLISAVPQKKVAREYRVKAFLFFLSFLFFLTLMVGQGYPTVMQSLQEWERTR